MHNVFAGRWNVSRYMCMPQGTCRAPYCARPRRLHDRPYFFMHAISYLKQAGGHAGGAVELSVQGHSASLTD